MNGIQRGTATALSLLLLAFAAPVGSAGDYHSMALEYLAEKLSVDTDSIVLHGHLQDLPHTGEQLWVGRYYVAGNDGDAVRPSGDDQDEVPGSGEDGRTPGTSDGTEPADTPKILPAPIEGEGSDPSPAVISAGAIVIRLVTGEILDYEDAMPLFERERQLQQQEWERLSREAGRISVPLYSRLIEASPGDMFDVVIYPHYVETEEMLRAIEEILEDYPDLHWRPIFRGEPDAGITGEYQIMPAPSTKDSSQPGGVAPEPAARPDADDAVVDMIVKEDPEQHERYMEMYERLEQVRRQGYEDSVNRIIHVLDGMGVSYEVDPGFNAVRAEMTADQVLSLRDADYIASIGDPIYLLPMDMMLRTEAASDAAPAFDETSVGRLADADRDDHQGANPWLALALLFLAGGGTAVLVSRRRR